MQTKVEQFAEAQELIAGYASQAVGRANMFAESHISRKFVAKSIGLLLALNTLAITMSPAEDSHAFTLERAELECITKDTCDEVFSPGKPRALEKTPSTAIPPTTSEAPPETTSTISPPVVTVETASSIPNVLQSQQLESALAPEQQRAIANVETMQLTRESYVNALSTINTEFYEYAQSKPKFTVAEMERQKIPQGKTVFITEHVTAGYYNANGTVTEHPVGDASNPQLFIDKISSRGGSVCCAVNQFLDRNAMIYWLAPRSAKLRHNYGYDGQTTGKEIEGYLNQDLTKAQLEASAYLDIGNLFAEDMHTKPLEETIRGHARTRDQYNEANPGDKQDTKVDWQEEVTAAYRRKLAEFMQANPDLAELTPQSFLALP